MGATVDAHPAPDCKTARVLDADFHALAIVPHSLGIDVHFLDREAVRQDGPARLASSDLAFASFFALTSAASLARS